MLDRLFGDALFRFAIEAIAFCLRQDILSALILIYSSFYSRHSLVWEEAAALLIAHTYMTDALMTHRLFTASLRVEMVLPGRSREDLAVLCEA